jgi:RimJ/RimL family protein N-acetyltransferase
MIIQPARASEIRSLALRDAAASPSSRGESAIAPPDVLAMLADLAASIEPHFAPAAWWLLDDAGETVGLCSITRVPSQGEVDIGYGIAPSFQRRGIATRAIAELARWAREDVRVARLTAETSIHNVASQRVLERNAFEVVGSRTDAEDGELSCWALAT